MCGLQVLLWYDLGFEAFSMAKPNLPFFLCRFNGDPTRLDLGLRNLLTAKAARSPNNFYHLLEVALPV
jgi:hypothetical protein